MRNRNCYKIEIIWIEGVLGGFETKLLFDTIVGEGLVPSRRHKPSMRCGKENEMVKLDSI